MIDFLNSTYSFSLYMSKDMSKEENRHKLMKLRKIRMSTESETLHMCSLLKAFWYATISEGESRVFSCKKNCIFSKIKKSYNFVRHLLNIY